MEERINNKFYFSVVSASRNATDFIGRNFYLEVWDKQRDKVLLGRLFDLDDCKFICERCFIELKGACFDKNINIILDLLYFDGEKQGVWLAVKQSSVNNNMGGIHHFFGLNGKKNKTLTRIRTRKFFSWILFNL
jgi:hypothetical protein